MSLTVSTVLPRVNAVRSGQVFAIDGGLTLRGLGAGFFPLPDARVIRGRLWGISAHLFNTFENACKGFGPVVVLGCAILPGAPPAAAAPDTTPTFTREQSERGHAVFDSNCSGCHGALLEGGPGGASLKDVAFRLRWDSQSVDALYTFIRAKMPPNNPGGFDSSVYVDLLAYILEGNGAVSGARPILSDPAQRASISLSDIAPPLAASAVQQELAHNAQRLKDLLPVPDAVSAAAKKRLAERMQGLRPVTDDMLENPPKGSWLNWRATYDARGFSPLTQINRRNVGQLRETWSWSLPSGPNEITPLVHDGIMFVASAGRVQALDAATGDFIWQYVREDNGVMRNIAIYGDRIFFPLGGHVIALNMRSGVEVWDHAVGTAHDGIRFTGGPIVAKGKVILGNTCGWTYPGGCFIVALDADTGREAWRLYTVARPGQPGGDSWNGAPLDKRFGGAAWIPGSYDPVLDLVFIGAAQTYGVTTLLDNASGVPGSNDGLYTDTTLALKPETGELVWYYQHTSREVWDLDWVFERTLATLNVKGMTRRTVTTAGKMGIFDTLDAATGAYLFSHDLGLQNLIAEIDPKTGVKKIAPGMEPTPNVEQLVCPSNVGGRDWPATAFNPATGIIYVTLLESCMPYKYVPGAAAGAFLRAPVPRPDADGKFGRLVAFDLVTGKTIWMKRRRAPEISAILATAGGLVFDGSRDRWFRASNDRTGEVLWETRLDGVPSSFPITYEVDGVQYIAVTTGGGNPVDGVSAILTPEIVNPAGGTTLWTFRLPKK